MTRRTAQKIYHLPWGGKDVPHLVLEPGQKCNLKCTACFKHKEDYLKPLDEIKKEIDFAISKRNLDVISILGGEPTLHPDLPEIIRYISDKGIVVMLLSNGLILNDELLRTYKKAGLKIVMLHIDSKQNRPDLPPNPTQKEVNELRDRLFAMVDKHGFRCGLSMTLYKSTLDRFADDVKYVMSSKFVNWMLAIRHSSVVQVKQLTEQFLPHNEETEGLYEWIRDEGSEETTVTVEDVEKVMNDNFSLLPNAYISSNMSTSEKRWIYFFTHSVIHRDGSYNIIPLDRRTLGFLMDAFQQIHRFVYGKYSFLGKANFLGGQRSFAIFEALFSLNPALILKTLAAVASSLSGRAVFTDKMFTIQFPPNLAAGGKLEYCHFCPDATIRNGHLLPVCVADIISPIHINERSAEVRQGYDQYLASMEINL